jgi:hypothetical protein
MSLFPKNMKPNKIKLSEPMPTPVPNYLLDWLSSEAALRYFGKSYAIRVDVLAALLTGGNLAAVARKHGVTRAATSKQHCRARAIFANLELTKGDLHD